MQILTLPGLTAPAPAPPPLKDGLLHHALLIGGNDADLKSFQERLRPRNIGVPWHWANKSATSRTFPQCDVVIAFTRASSHSLFYDVVARAKKAGVPVIHHDAWPLTLLALEKANIGTTPMAPTSDATRRPAPVDDATLLRDTRLTFNNLPNTTRMDIRTAARNADERNSSPMPPAAREYLHKFSGHPRTFIATLLAATPGQHLHMSQTGINRVYREVANKKLESDLINALAKKASEVLGSQYGIRRGDPFDLRSRAPVQPPMDKAVTEPTHVPVTDSVIVPHDPRVTLPDSVTTPAESTTPMTKTSTPMTNPTTPGPAQLRFLNLLLAALDSEDSVTITKVDGTYAIAYPDGTLVTIRPK